MDRKDERVSVFPPEYAHLQSSLNEIEQQISEFDNAIDNLPPDKGYDYIFSRPGGKDASPGYRRESSIRDFTARKSDLVKSFKDYIDKETSSLDPVTISEIKGFVEHRLSNNEYKDQSKEQLLEQRDEIKGDIDSFDFMASLHYSKYETPNTAPEEIIKDVDMTESFMSMLDYHRGQRNLEKSIDMDDIDLE